MSHPATVRDEEIPRRVYERRWYILVVLCLSLLVIVLANTSMNVALPTMAHDLQLTTSSMQWVVDSYALVFAGLLFTAGTLGDRFGRKGFLQAGLVVFGLGSVYATWLAHTSGELIGARAVMGLGGALVMPTTLSILVNTFPARERAKAIAIWSGIAGVGGAVGLALGGWLVEHFWWGSTFAINLPVCALALVAGGLLLPTSKDPAAPKVDLVGSLLSIAGLCLLVLGLIEAPHWGWLSMTTILALGSGVVLLTVFSKWERHARMPMLDISLFRDRRFGVSSLGMTLVFLVMFGFFFISIQYFQLVLGYGPFESGVRVLPFMPAMIVMSVLSPRFVVRFGARVVVGVGMLLAGIGVLMFSRLQIDSSYSEVLAGMFVMTTGMGLTTSPMTNLIMSSVPRDKAGMGSAMNDTTRELGTTLGVAIFGSLLASSYTGNLPSQISLLPAAARDAVQGSLGGALYVSEQIGGANGDKLALAARQAWMQGVHFAFVVGAGIVFLAALISFLFLDGRAQRPVALFDDIVPDDASELFGEVVAGD